MIFKNLLKYRLNVLDVLASPKTYLETQSEMHFSGIKYFSWKYRKTLVQYISIRNHIRIKVIIKIFVEMRNTSCETHKKLWAKKSFIKKIKKVMRRKYSQDDQAGHGIFIEVVESQGIRKFGKSPGIASEVLFLRVLLSEQRSSSK